MSGEAVPVTTPEPSLMEYIQRKNAGEPTIELKPENLAAEGAEVAPPTEVATEAPEVEETQLEADSEPGTEHEEGDEAKKPSKGGWQRRIDKLTDRLRQRDQELADFRAKQSKPAEVADPAETAKPQDGKPLIENYKTADEWADARDAWKLEQERKEDFQERQKVVFENFNKQVSQVREQNEDFDEVMSQNIVIPMSVQEAIPTLDNGAAVAYHIAKNPDIAAKLMTMLPTQAIAEVGRISERLLSATSTVRPPTKEKIVSKATAPIQPVDGTIKSTVALEDLTPSDYIAKRNAQVAKRQAG